MMVNNVKCWRLILNNFEIETHCLQHNFAMHFHYIIQLQDRISPFWTNIVR